MEPPTSVEWHDVQGIVVRGYGELPCSANLLLKITDSAGARQWLEGIVGRISTTEQVKSRDRDCFLNIAFTKTGLSALGLPDEAMQTFPSAFYEGMATPHRSRILGDTGDSEPPQWKWGGPDHPVDVLVMVFARDTQRLAQQVQTELAQLGGTSAVLNVLETHLPKDQHEHFGFKDGISQPIIEGSPITSRRKPAVRAGGKFDSSNVIKAGEFILGYLNEYGRFPRSPTVAPEADPGHLLPIVQDDSRNQSDLGRNGTFMVVRDLQQHVTKFWQYLDSIASSVGGENHDAMREKLAAKLVGRWRSGAPLATTPDKDDPARAAENDFTYTESDPHGLGCPFGSHIRRSNPRDSVGDDPQKALRLTKRHRLLRRGRSYGSRIEKPLEGDDAHPRGLLFISINADIERQFEFVQQTWVNNQSFQGLYEEQDPLLGCPTPSAGGTMTIPEYPIRRRIQNLGGFVTVRGGSYFFLPGIKALRYLVALSPSE